MAVAISAPPTTKKTAHADTNAVEYQLPDNVNRMTVQIIGQAGSVAFTGTDAAAQVADAFPIVADVPFSFRLKSGTGRTEGIQRVYVAAAAATDVHVMAESD